MDRFWDKVDKSGDCWVWTASINKKGYGWFKFGGRMMLAHRVSYELEIGEITDGLLVLHRCDNPSCVNPEHLYLGDHDTNMADRVSRRTAANARKTHCLNGHELSGSNLYVYPSGRKRECRTCQRSRHLSYKES